MALASAATAGVVVTGVVVAGVVVTGSSSRWPAGGILRPARSSRSHCSRWSSSDVALPAVVDVGLPATVEPVAGIVERRQIERLGERSDPVRHRAEHDLAGDADQLDGAVLVLHAGQVDHDRVALAEDLRLGHAERVDAGAVDVGHDIEGVGVEAPHRLQRDRRAALEVESELR